MKLRAIAFVLLLGCETTPPPSPPTQMFAAGDAYERFMGRWGTELAPLLVRFTGVKDGDRVVDVGAGTGALSISIESSMPSSRVVGIDPSAGLLALAKKRAKSDRLTFEVGDAQAMKFEDGAFDDSIAQLVMNFVPDHEKALREMRRVTKAGGVVSACVWDYGDGMQSLRAFWDEAVALDPAIASKDERNMKLSKRGELGDLWKKVGFDSVEEAQLSFDQRFDSFEDYWTPFLDGAGPGGEYVRSLEPPRRDQLGERLRMRLSKNGQPFTLRATANCVKGIVPAR